MAKLLYIKANARPEGVSRTYRISNSFIDSYREYHPADEITTLDLYKDGIAFLPAGDLMDLHRPADPEKGRDHPVLKYAFQFLEADNM